MGLCGTGWLHYTDSSIINCVAPATRLDSFISFWDELNAIVSPTLLAVKQEGSLSHEVEGADEETSEEEWEDVGEGDAGGSGEGGEGVP